MTLPIAQQVVLGQEGLHPHLTGSAQGSDGVLPACFPPGTWSPSAPVSGLVW